MENKTEVLVTNEELLKELGFNAASAEIDAKKILKRKLMVAYEHFRFVTPDQITAFNHKLYQKTLKGYTYDQLRFTPVQQYRNAPPVEVLDEMKKAVGFGCFDSFEVVDIQAVEKRPDPILFGLIKGCSNRFFVSQWDNDVKIEDILKESEG